MNKTNIDSAFEDLQLLQHPFYRDWMEGKLSPETLRHYAAQYLLHVDSFPRYISAIHSLCDDPAARKKILENLNEEEGTGFGKSHPDLWRQFANGLGVSGEDLSKSEPGPAIRNVVDRFFHFSRSSYAQGLGALYAYESQVPEIADSKLDGLKNRYGVTDEASLAFFEVHRHADIEHREVVKDLIAALPEKEQLLAAKSARAAAQSLWDFLTEMRACA